MIKLAAVFQDEMTLQRGKPCKIWGQSSCQQEIDVLIDGEKIAKYKLLEGDFVIWLPPQDVREDAALRIGDIELLQVDFGDVWIAGGQSNMEFALKYDREYEDVREKESDFHLRYYEVARYSFEGEEQDHFKDDEKWNQWLVDSAENRGEFSAVAFWFASELRERYHIPVAIVSCNWGGTSASAWVERELLMQKKSLQVYLDDYEYATKDLDLETYCRKDYIERKMTCSLLAKKANDYVKKNTVSMEEIAQYSIQLAIEAGMTQ